jgi:hypothetical protein
MGRIWFAASLATCACVGNMVRAPKQIPADGVVTCTDSMETPITATVVAVASAGAIAIALTHMAGTIDTGGVIWLPVLSSFGIQSLFAAGEGYARARECSDAKERGAQLAGRNDARAKARADAGTLWKRGASAARADDCATVRELDPQIRELDVEFHDVVFVRDVGIARCLAAATTD